MKLGMSTCCHGRLLRKPDVHFTCEESLNICKAGGFSVINIDLIEYSKPGQPLRKDDWEKWIITQREIANQLNLQILYGHAPFYSWNAFEPYEDSLYEELISRSIKAAGIVGVKQLVFHPFSFVNADWYDYDKLLQQNIKAYTKYAEECSKYGIKTVIENMMEPGKTRKYGSSVEEILTLYEKLQNRGDFGICWDFGHGHLSEIEQRKALLAIGNRLTMLHVSDNFGLADDHLAPYFGSIDWQCMMNTLHEIKYSGDFLFENFSFFDGAPAELRVPIMKLCRSIGEYLVNMFESFDS